MCAYLAAVYLAWESRGDLQADFRRPDLTVAGAAAPSSTLSLTAATLPLGVAAVVPSLWWLFAVFKERNPQSRGE